MYRAHIAISKYAPDMGLPDLPIGLGGCRALMKDRRAAAWRMLTPAEKDALIVLTAMCKVGKGGSDTSTQ